MTPTQNPPPSTPLWAPFGCLDLWCLLSCFSFMKRLLHPPHFHGTWSGAKCLFSMCPEDRPYTFLVALFAPAPPDFSLGTEHLFHSQIFLERHTQPSCQSASKRNRCYGHFIKHFCQAPTQIISTSANYSLNNLLCQCCCRNFGTD